MRIRLYVSMIFLFMSASLLFGSTGQDLNWVVLDSTSNVTSSSELTIDTNTLNTVAIFFPKETREIYAIKKSTTGSVYLNFVSTYTVLGATNTFELREGFQDWRTEDIYSTRMSIYSEDPSLDLRIQIKY